MCCFFHQIFSIPVPGPAVIQTLNSTSSNITIEWLPPEYLNNKLAAYNLMIIEQNDPTVRHKSNIMRHFLDPRTNRPLTPMKKVVGGLKSNTTYQVQLTTYNVWGKGPTVEAVVRTRRENAGKEGDAK